MSKLRDLIFLLPDYELEGYPRSLPSEQAARLLSGWLCLWHPGLIAAANAIPRWNQASQLPADLDNTVFVLPEISRDHVSEENRSKISAAGGILLEPTESWRELQTELIGRLGEIQQSELADELLEQFAALGYAYLQIQLMTRQLRYTSNLDQLQFSEQACKAVDAAFAGDRERAEQMLQACFDSLGQERDHYYSLDVNLVDVTLLAETTLGSSFSQQLELDTPTTLLASASLLRQLKSKNPDAFARVQRSLTEHELALAGGLDQERPHPLMPRESAARDLYRGKLAYEALGLSAPRVFARLSFGMHTETASMLKRFGYDGVMLTAWTTGAYPEGSQVKMSWESSDGTFLPALAAPVIDAMDPASFLSLGWIVGESLDHQHVPTLTLAHWPGATCDFYSLLRIIVGRTPAFGKWRLADEYFVETDQPYHQERLVASAFQNNWLADSSSPAVLIEQTKRVHELQARSRGLQNLLNLCWQLIHYGQVVSAVSQEGDETLIAKTQVMPSDVWANGLSELNDMIDSLFDHNVDVDSVLMQAKEQCDRLRQHVLESMGQHLARSSTKSARSDRGRLILNAYSCPMRAHVHTPASESLDAEADWHFASGRVGNDRVTCVDVPSLGFVVAPVVDSGKAESNRQPVIASAGGLLQNEFLEAQIDTGRGHLKSLHVPARRGNRLSVMLAHRRRGEKGVFHYSDMVASDVRMLTSSSMSGIIRATGKLEEDGHRIGKFEIDYEVRRGSRVLEIAVRLSDLKPHTESNPWKSATILRVAWPNEAAILRTFGAGTQSAWGNGRGIAPQLIEIDETDYKTHILTGGLAFHRRTETRFLETILAVNGQSSITHRFGIAVELPSPTLAARRFLDRNYELPITGAVNSASGWLVSVDVRSVAVDLEAPLVNEAGQLVGLRLFVTENSGKSTSVNVSLLREIAAAHRVDYLGGRISKLTVDGDRVVIGLRANEQVNIDVLWSGASVN